MGAFLTKCNLMQELIGCFPCVQKRKQRNQARAHSPSAKRNEVYENFRRIHESHLNPGLKDKPVTQPVELSAPPNVPQSEPLKKPKEEKALNKPKEEEPLNKPKEEEPLNKPKEEEPLKKPKIQPLTIPQLKEFKRLESKINLLRKSEKTTSKDLVGSLLKRDLPVKKPMIIDCNSCADCLSIQEEIERMEKPKDRKFRIKKIFNAYTEANYILRKKEYQTLYGKSNVTELLMYHGTAMKCVNSIIKKNFDWRLYGKQHGCLLGKGTCFADTPAMAEYYCGEFDSIKCIVVSKVLLSSASYGNSNTVFPAKKSVNKRHDSTISSRQSESILVKYRDDDFWPTHVIYFTDNEGINLPSEVESLRRANRINIEALL